MGGAPVIFSGRNLTCARGGRTVFSDLGFTVADGTILLLRGPNGSGKSSLLRLAAGFLALVEGGFFRDGRPLHEDIDGHHASLAYVGHLDAVKPAFSVAENLNFWVALGGGSELAAAAALDRMGLGGLADMPAAYLSAGQRRRLNLARLAASDAQLWLLDEPTVALDDASVHSLVALIAEHQSRGGLAMIASHADLAVERTETLDLGTWAARPE